MTTTLALDTCVISDMGFINWAKSESDVELVVPSIVYMERKRQLLNHGKDPMILEDLLRRYHINITQFDKNCASLAAEYMHKQPKVCDKCNKLDWMDVMILSSIERPQAILVTKNIRDFEPYGIRNRILSPDEAVQLYSKWSDWRL